ncbi:hypothetical protein L1887_50654 [Cichorium endivia]|nr:hypothetical protein L1887_50654 [Cichorium endivia]
MQDCQKLIGSNKGEVSCDVQRRPLVSAIDSESDPKKQIKSNPSKARSGGCERFLLSMRVCSFDPTRSNGLVNPLCDAYLTSSGRRPLGCRRDGGVGGVDLVDRHLVVVVVLKVDGVKDDADDERAARTPGDVLGVLELLARDLEAVATGTWVVEEILLLVINHVLELDLVVERDGHDGSLSRLRSSPAHLAVLVEEAYAKAREELSSEAAHVDRDQ